MNEKHIWSKRPESMLDWFCVVGACIAFYLLLNNLGYFLGRIGIFINILSPFAGGIVIAYILDPMVKFFYVKLFKEKKGTRGFAILLAYAVAILLLVLLGWLGGFAAGAQAIGGAYRRGQLTARQAESLLPLCITVSPAFIFVTVGQLMLNSRRLGLALLGAIFGSNLICGLAAGRWWLRKITVSSAGDPTPVPHAPSAPDFSASSSAYRSPSDFNFANRSEKIPSVKPYRRKNRSSASPVLTRSFACVVMRS